MADTALVPIARLLDRHAVQRAVEREAHLHPFEVGSRHRQTEPQGAHIVARAVGQLEGNGRAVPRPLDNRLGIDRRPGDARHQRKAERARRKGGRCHLIHRFSHFSTVSLGAG